MVPNAYRLAVAAARRIPLPESKLAQSRFGRMRAASRWVDWASRERTAEPLVWVHGASVGEGLTAAPVIARVRAAVRGIQVVYTFSSPSAAGWPDRFGADRTDYVPLDTERDVGRTLRALKPDLLVASRGDVWPELAAGVHRLGIPLAVLGATVRLTSKRLRWPFRSLFHHMHQAVAWLGAATDADAARWRKLGVRAEAITVTGDPRHDQIIERVSRIDAVGPLLRWARARTVLVGGSTEPQDEALLLGTLGHLAASQPPLGLVLVPHDPTPARIGQIMQFAARRYPSVAVWRGGALKSGIDCVVVATVGMLADLYLVADVAYVGGGFRKGHLHSVIEPASHAVPVVFGPEYAAFPDAVELVRSGGGASLPRRPGRGEVDQALGSLLRDHERRVEMGLRARATLSQGAARATARALMRLMETGHQTECPESRK